MRYSTEHKELTRKKILDAAGRRFRAEGYDGLGIDGLAKAAGVTNGAFYGHFDSKADAFREVATLGLEELREGIERYQSRFGADWLAEFSRFYFSAAKLDVPENACALPSFAPEMARAPHSTRVAFEAGLVRVVEAIAAGLNSGIGDERLSKAWTILALLSGGVTMARSVHDEQVRNAIIASLLAAICNV